MSPYQGVEKLFNRQESSGPKGDKFVFKTASIVFYQFAFLVKRCCNRIILIRKYYCTVKTVFINPNPHPTPPLKHLNIDVFLGLNMRHT